MKLVVRMKRSAKRRLKGTPFYKAAASGWHTLRRLRRGARTLIHHRSMLRERQAANKELLAQISSLRMSTGAAEHSIAALREDIGIRDRELHDTRLQYQELLSEIDTLNAQICFANAKRNPNVTDLLFAHGGSGNHGCEALVRTISELCGFRKQSVALYSFAPEEDIHFGIGDLVDDIRSSFWRTRAEEFAHEHFRADTVAYHIGGDNYCGSDFFSAHNAALYDQGVKTALIGCSIDNYIINKENGLDDLDRYALITVRESASYELLVENGISRNTRLIPDSAFVLPVSEPIDLPDALTSREIVGINASALVMSCAAFPDVALKNFLMLVRHILENTKYGILLISHVHQKNNDDLAVLEQIKAHFPDDRVSLADIDLNCMQIKYLISQCKMLICCRTHASIAAYSTAVPTQVVGYSVKSTGIAKDLFGTDENYVIPIENLTIESVLVNAFLWLEGHCDEVRAHLERVMPEYIDRCSLLADAVNEVKSHNLPASLATHDLCFGCGACASACPHGCISIAPDERGFAYPRRDFKTCIRCGICTDVCPIYKPVRRNTPICAFAAENIDDSERARSSSGGIFALLSKAMLAENGVVFGAAFDSRFDVEHVMAETSEELAPIMGSKYIQSDMTSCFGAITELLNRGTRVLFSGTPCQVMALKSFLGGNTVNLTCVEVICHGVASPQDWREHLERVTASNGGAKITHISMRDKVTGWRDYSSTYRFDNGESLSFRHEEDGFMSVYLNQNPLRPSCFRCRAKDYRSGADITIGDYWGIENIHPEMNDDMGTSVVILRSEAGKRLYDLISSRIRAVPTDLSAMDRYNPMLLRSIGKMEDK